RVDDPVCRRRQGVGGSVEVVAPHQAPAGGRAWYGGLRLQCCGNRRGNGGEGDRDDDQPAPGGTSATGGAAPTGGASSAGGDAHGGVLVHGWASLRSAFDRPRSASISSAISRDAWSFAAPRMTAPVDGRVGDARERSLSRFYRTRWRLSICTLLPPQGVR